MAPLKAFVAATAVAAFQPARVGPSNIQPRRSIALGAVQPSRTARILHKVTFGLLGEEQLVEERPVFFQEGQSAAPAPRRNNYGDELEMFMDDESRSKPNPPRTVLKAPSKIVDGDEGDEDDDEEPALKAPPRLETAMASEESIAKLNAPWGCRRWPARASGGKPEEEPEPAACRRVARSPPRTNATFMARNMNMGAHANVHGLTRDHEKPSRWRPTAARRQRGGSAAPSTCG